MTLALRAEDLRTPRTLLRPLEPRDTDAVHAWQRDPEVTRYLPYPPRTREQTEAFVEGQAHRRGLRTDGDRVVYAIVRQPGREVVGELHLVLRRAAIGEVELGWVLAPGASGQGLATEAAGAVRDFALQHGAHRVIAQLDPRNAASIAVCRRLGMRQEALFRADFPDADSPGGWSDTAVFGLVAGDAVPAIPPAE